MEEIRLTGVIPQSEHRRLARKMSAYMTALRIVDMARVRGVCKILRMNECQNL